MGVPAHKTSMPVVCPLQRGVSKQTSASWPRRTCSSCNDNVINSLNQGGLEHLNHTPCLGWWLWNEASLIQN